MRRLVRIVGLCGSFFLLLRADHCPGHKKKSNQCQSSPTAPCPPPETPQFTTGLQVADQARQQNYYTASPPFSGASLPASVDLSDKLPTPGSQGTQNSCVGWAVAYGLKTYQERVERSWSLSQQTTFSPAFIYNQLNGGRDAGLYFEHALNLVQSSGVAPLSQMPYNERDYLTQPSTSARTAATAYKIERW